MAVTSGRRQPNVVLVMTDDQGYGDLGCTGNPWLRTPNIDAFAGTCVRLTDFHVSPLCTPTRGALMTGHRPVRNGAWATTWGRSMLRRDEVTMADVFAGNGYRTGMFGKWHLGDNVPYRPQDRGFQTVVAHRGGGVGQTPDFWGNSYFDDTYFHNGRPTAHEGYCTDIWFDEAMAFMAACGDEPFFCYLATNAPHAPYRVAERYEAPYSGNRAIPEPAFYGMIGNIDENMGRLIRRLTELGLAENTILVFMTDNGSSGGWREQAGQGYNAGMRGAKGSYYDGGHRVPFFLRWPGAGLGGGVDRPDMVLHVDLLPTFIELCGLDGPAGVTFDGVSAAGLLHGTAAMPADRIHFLQYRQHTNPPEKWDNAVMTPRWRLIRGTELYDIKADPGQAQDVAGENPDVVRALRAAHEDWWAEVAPTLEEYGPITLGSDLENPTRLDAFDLMGDVAWSQEHVREASRCSGAWAVDIEQDGFYELRLRRWPAELGLPLDAALEDDGAPGIALDVVSAHVTIGAVERTQPVQAGAEDALFTVPLQAGRARLEATFIDREGDERAAYYVYVKRLDAASSSHDGETST